jgi:hypothetical protein
MRSKEQIESQCWQTIRKWCALGDHEMRFTVEFHSDDPDTDPEQEIPTLCAFKDDQVVSGFNSDDYLTALVLAANWCQEEVSKATVSKTVSAARS